jgi:hypothetical protein
MRRLPDVWAIKSTTGEMLPGASVEVLHKPTGTKYYSTTDVDGKYAVQGLDLVDHTRL